jgi:hypothetical protein
MDWLSEQSLGSDDDDDDICSAWISFVNQLTAAQVPIPTDLQTAIEKYSHHYDSEGWEAENGDGPIAPTGQDQDEWMLGADDFHQMMGLHLFDQAA